MQQVRKCNATLNLNSYLSLLTNSLSHYDLIFTESGGNAIFPTDGSREQS